MSAIPRAEERPTLPLWPDVGQALDLGRSSTYAAAERGEIPTLRLGNRIVVPTAALRKMLQLDERDEDPATRPGPRISTASARTHERRRRRAG